ERAHADDAQIVGANVLEDALLRMTLPHRGADRVDHHDFAHDVPPRSTMPGSPRERKSRGAVPQPTGAGRWSHEDDGRRTPRLLSRLLPHRHNRDTRSCAAHAPRSRADGAGGDPPGRLAPPGGTATFAAMRVRGVALLVLALASRVRAAEIRFLREGAEVKTVDVST